MSSMALRLAVAPGNSEDRDGTVGTGQRGRERTHCSATGRGSAGACEGGQGVADERLWVSGEQLGGGWSPTFR